MKFEFFTESETQTFLAIALNHFEAKGIDFTFHEDMGVIKISGGRQFGLLTIAQHCLHRDPLEWPSLIAAYFERISQGFEEGQSYCEERSYDRVCDRLMVRLYPADVFDTVDSKHFVFQCSLEGTLSVLVYDLPNSTETVTPNQAQAWGQSDEQLFEKALQNTIADYPVEVVETDLDDGQTFYLLGGEEFYVSSHVLALESYPFCIGPQGALVGVPNRYAVLCYPISGVETVSAVNHLIPMIHHMEIEGPGSISPNLYWYREGKFLTLPYVLEDDRIEFNAPNSFIEMLIELGGSDESD
jgi:hypothetical protein